jgi:uncharacterized membrane protein
VAKKAVTNKKKNIEETKTEQPAVIFLGEKSNKSASLITLGLIAVVIGFLSATPIIARTIFSEPADYIIVMGLVGIVVGLILNNRQRISDLFNSNKKNQ